MWKNKSLWIVILCMLAVVESFHVSSLSSRIQWNGSSRRMMIAGDTTNEKEKRMKRRFVLKTIFYGVVGIVSPVVATEGSDDLLNAFGKSLSSENNNNNDNSSFIGTTSGYPYSPSPLPTNSKSAEEFSFKYGTSIPSNSQEQPGGQKKLNQVLNDAKESQKRRSVDPRSHG